MKFDNSRWNNKGEGGVTKKKEDSKSNTNNTNINSMSLDRRIYEFCQNQLEWLEMELRDTDDGNNKKQHVLGHLSNSDISLGLYGRTILTLSKDASSSSSSTTLILPSHSFQVGDDVHVESYTTSNNSSCNSNTSTSKMEGVISALNDYSISITLYETDQELQNNNSSNCNEEQIYYRLVPKSMIQVHRKIVSHIKKLQSSWDTLPSFPIIQAAFSSSSAPPNYTTTTTSMMNPQQQQSSSNNQQPPPLSCPSHLNHVQWNAILSCLSTNHVISLIHGPPGTGKTTTVAEYIYHALHHPSQNNNDNDNDNNNSCYKRPKILVTAPSNVAVDNILCKCISTLQHYNNLNNNKNDNHNNKSSSIQMVRIGHPARMDEKMIPYSLESYIRRNDGTDIVQDVKKELQELVRWKSPKEFSKLQKNNDKNPNYNNYNNNRWKEMKLLRNEIRKREQIIVQQTLERSDVIFTTNVGAASKLLSKLQFDIVVMDEAAQATEASSWIPLLRGTSKVVLAGDHCQLPPTVLSDNPIVRQGLSQTLFERLITTTTTNYNNASSSTLLSIQYRMHPTICNWSSQAMYNHKLTSHSTMSQRTLRHLLLPPSTNNNNQADQNHPTQDNNINTNTNNTMLDTNLLLIDTSQCEMYELDETNNHNNNTHTTKAKNSNHKKSSNNNNNSSSRSNPGEAKLVEQHVSYLIEECGLKAKDIAIISPYRGQVELLKKGLLLQKYGGYGELEIKSVDGFQGGEREAVILSLVRSSPPNCNHGIGFLAEPRRLNVAITRAKRHCAVICNAQTISQNPFLQQLITYIEDHGDYQSALNYTTTTDNTTNYHSNPPTNPTTTTTTITQQQEWIQDILTSSSNVNNDNKTKVKHQNSQKLPSKSKTKKKVSSHNNNNNNNNNNGKKEKVSSLRKEDYDSSKDQQQQQQQERRKKLEDKLTFFKNISLPGEILEFDETLSSYDRRMVHDIAEQLDLEHKSEGIEGINRKITVRQRQQTKTILLQPTNHNHNTNNNNKTTTTITVEKDENDDEDISLSNGFLDLFNDEDDAESSPNSSDLEENNQPNAKKKMNHNNNNKEEDKVDESPYQNDLLHQLAMEREARQRAQPPPSQTTSSKQKKKKKKKKTNQKGPKQTNSSSHASDKAKKKNEDSDLDDSDDMAFLDAQIDKVQNSHGRTIVGSGKTYRTIVNGMLISKPKPPSEPKKNSRLVSSLSSKIKESQAGRQPKASKKKKKK